jgi:hypothetical protein
MILNEPLQLNFAFYLKHSHEDLQQENSYSHKHVTVQ